MTWQKDVNYSDTRHGVEKILTFPSLSFVGSASVVSQFTLTEDIRVVELGAFVTTTVSSTTPTTVILKESASDVTMATLTIITLGDTATTTRQATITNATAATSGSVLLLELGITAEDSGTVVPYIKYLAEFN